MGLHLNVWGTFGPDLIFSLVEKQTWNANQIMLILYLTYAFNYQDTWGQHLRTTCVLKPCPQYMPYFCASKCLFCGCRHVWHLRTFGHLEHHAKCLGNRCTVFLWNCNSAARTSDKPWGRSHISIKVSCILWDTIIKTVNSNYFALSFLSLVHISAFAFDYLSWPLLLSCLHSI